MHRNVLKDEKSTSEGFPGKDPQAHTHIYKYVWIYEYIKNKYSIHGFFKI